MVAGNPARIIKQLPEKPNSDSQYHLDKPNSGAEVPLAQMAEKLEDGTSF